MENAGIYFNFIPLLIATAYALYKRRTETIVIGCVMVVAFFITRYITVIVEGPRYMMDMRNDMAAMIALLFILGNKSYLVRGMALTYVAMTFGGYLPVHMEWMTNDTKAIVLEMITLFQILIVAGGSSDGYRNWVTGKLGDMVDAGGVRGAPVHSEARMYNQTFDSAGNLVVSGDR